MDASSNIGIDIVERADVVVVAVEGELDLYAAALFTRSLAIAAATDAPSIVLDLDRVSFMDSAGVHVLLQFSMSERCNRRLSVTRGSAQVRRLLDVTGVRRYLSFVASPGVIGSGHPPTARLRLTG
jgi:anti-sigma B factor antagonist